MTQTAELNSRLQECQQIYQRVIGMAGDLAGLRVSDIPTDRRVAFANDVCSLSLALIALGRLLVAKNLSEAIGEVASGPWKFYREVIEPNKSHIARLASDVLQAIGYDIRQEDIELGGKGDKVANILFSGLDYWRLDDSEYTEQELDEVEQVLQAPWFAPDRWIQNASKVLPVLGPKAKQVMPSSLRIRIEELTRCYLFDNHLSVIALARAILEYALIDRASKLGINPKKQDQQKSEYKRLGRLVEEVAESRPELKTAMEQIVEAGNRTLHPRKDREHIMLLPEYLRGQAFCSIQAIHQVVHELYLSK